MARIHYLVFGLFFISACVTVAENNEAPMPETQAQTVPAAASEVQSASNPSTESLAHGSNEVTNRNDRIPSKEEIKSLQVQLKAAGFDPGSADGILGHKTKTALSHLQSGCVNLKDLLDGSASVLSRQTNGIETSKPDSATDTFPTKEEIRLIQVRLRDSGFDPGPFDGTLGPRTKSALLRMQSGCVAVKDFPVHLDIQMTERPSLPVSDSEKQLQSAVNKTVHTAESVGNGAGQVALRGDNAPSGEQVQGVQMRLRNAGFDPGPIDGVLGPKTKSALDQYRASYGAMSARKLLSGIRFDY